MITSVRFQNFKALRDVTLPLGRFTLIVGPNGSGKSTAMQAFQFVLGETPKSLQDWSTHGSSQSSVKVHVTWLEDGNEYVTGAVLTNASSFTEYPSETDPVKFYAGKLRNYLKSFRIFSFDASAIAAAVDTSPHPQLGEDGSNLAAVLDALRDTHPERFEALNQELNRWLPEFDRILFETPAKGRKSFLVRTSVGHHRLRASSLSQGVLFALAFLALAYLPEPPSIVCFEEPDRGIHPRLLVDIRDAMYRLAFPENYGEEREPVQVIATTHSPYLLDLYKEHPEQIVIAHKNEKGVHFERLSEKPHLNEILEGAPLGDIWFSGILGGVPSAP
ncbi:MAG TPA: AAA family ATPase [Pyrinomonadaceae bacterium]|nr:AAA family ATPase [Pyrinomonadaceae bacterium]